MFEQILQAVNEYLGNNPQIHSALPANQQEAVHQEVANQIHNGLQTEATAQGGIGGLLSQFEGGLANRSLATSAIAGGLMNSLTSKFGLSPAITGAIAAALPAILQKFAEQSHGQQDAQSQNR